MRSRNCSRGVWVTLYLIPRRGRQPARPQSSISIPAVAVAGQTSGIPM